MKMKIVEKPLIIKVENNEKEIRINGLSNIEISFKLAIYFKKTIKLIRNKKFSEKFAKRFFIHLKEIIIDVKGKYELQDLIRAEHQKIEDKELLSELIRTFNNEFLDNKKDFLKKKENN